MTTALFIATFLVGFFVGSTTLALVLIYLMSAKEDKLLTMVRAEDGEQYIVYVPQQ